MAQSRRCNYLSFSIEITVNAHKQISLRFICGVRVINTPFVVNYKKKEVKLNRIIEATVHLLAMLTFMNTGVHQYFFP